MVISLTICLRKIEAIEVLHIICGGSILLAAFGVSLVSNLPDDSNE